MFPVDFCCYSIKGNFSRTALITIQTVQLDLFQRTPYTENKVHFEVIFKHYKTILQLLLVNCAISINSFEWEIWQMFFIYFSILRGFKVNLKSQKCCQQRNIHQRKNQ